MFFFERGLCHAFLVMFLAVLATILGLVTLYCRDCFSTFLGFLSQPQF